MATYIVNKQQGALHGKSKMNEALNGLGYKKIVVVEVDDMSLVANNDVVYTLPCIALLQTVIVHNYGTTAFAIATSAALDVGGTDITDSIMTLAAGAANMLYLGDVMVDVSAAGTQILWDFGGANSSLATAKARIIIEFLAVEDIDI